MRKTIVLCIGVLLIGTLFTHVSARTLQISQGFTYWNATSKLSWDGPSYKGDAAWYGLKIDIVAPNVWWVECLLSTGEENYYYDGLDTIYAREARFLAGLSSPEFGLGVGGIWMSVDYRGCLPPYNSFGAIATVQAQVPISLDQLTANVAIVAQPIVFGKNPLPGEFIELYAGMNMEFSWLKINAGYRYRYYYNFGYDYQVSGLVISFQLGLGEDGI